MELSITIPAKVGQRDGVFPVVVPASEVFACIAATAEFQVAPDTAEKRSARKGSAWGNPGAKTFSRLTFFNSSASDIDVTFFAGNADNRPNTPLADGNVVIVTDPAENTTAAFAEFFKVVAGSNVAEAITAAALYFQKVWLYPAKSAVATGGFTANTGDIYIGTSAACFSEKKTNTDVDLPYYIEAPTGQNLPLSSIRIIAVNIGDGVFVRYVP